MNLQKHIPALVLLVALHSAGAPIAWYTFDDPADRYKDISGNGYHGTENGSGTSFSSSGVSGLGDAMNSTTSGEMWVNTPINEVSLSDFAISFWATDGSDWDNWLSFGSSSTDAITLMNYAGNNRLFINNLGGVPGFNSYDVDAWLGAGLNHIVLTANSAADTVAIYLNGERASSNSWSVAASETIGYLTIGGSRVDAQREINATIDDVQIYDEALSFSDVSALYNSPGSVVPEPATISMLALCSALGLFIRRRFID